MLFELLQQKGPAELAAYVAAGLPMPGATFDRNAFFARFAGIPRRARGLPLPLTAADDTVLTAVSLPGASRWSAPRAWRVGMLERACAALPADAHVALVREAYDKGDNDEKVAVLSSLVLLPEPQRLIEVAKEACRSHSLDVFDAIACDNAYASLCFEELHFNQLVMKVYFHDLPAARVVGLHGRKNTELARMAKDFSAERRAAGRPVPADLYEVMS